MRKQSVKYSAMAFAVVSGLAGGAMIAVDFAEARSGRGSSFGSRGSKTFQAPPATKTAPSPSPVQKSISQPGRAGPTAAAASGASRFGGMRGLLLGGLLGAGLMSMFGLGGGLAAFLGFALQMLLIAGLVFLVISFFRRRAAANQPAMARASAGGPQGPATPGPEQAMYRNQSGGFGGASAPPLAIVGDDYTAFERLLKEVQLGYANADIDALGERVTPEVLSQFAHDLEDNKRRGLSNDLSEPRLLQGDLAESWREADGEFATVAMRYEMIDALVDKASGRVVEGSTTEPQEITEVWTFRRPVGGNASQWELSAIQQA